MVVTDALIMEGVGDAAIGNIEAESEPELTR